MLDTVLVIFALLALIGVVFEEKIHINKAKITLFFGTFSWLLLFAAAKQHNDVNVITEFESNVSEIATLWLFLISAMTFVAYLNKKGMIENLIYILLPKRISEFKMMMLTALFCFLFSSLADNITATLVSVALVLSLKMPTAKTIKYMVLVVFAVNSGGVALITGDVTTLMIFLDHRVTIPELLWLSLPSFVGTGVLALLLSRGLKDDVRVQPHRTDVRPVDVSIAVLFICTIVGSMVANVVFDIPPMLTFLAGMSAMFLLAHFFKEDIDRDPIMDYIRLIEFETLMFFLGVLLIVGSLKEIHVLDYVSDLYTLLSPVAANYVMGLLSAVVDNVPLTAALLKSSIDMSVRDWMVLTYAVGVGGSLLVIGSSAGIVAMSKARELTFGVYCRYILPLLVAYSVGYAGVYAIGSLQ